MAPLRTIVPPFITREPLPAVGSARTVEMVPLVTVKVVALSVPPSVEPPVELKDVAVWT